MIRRRRRTGGRLQPPLRNRRPMPPRKSHSRSRSTRRPQRRRSPPLRLQRRQLLIPSPCPCPRFRFRPTRRRSRRQPPRPRTQAWRLMQAMRRCHPSGPRRRPRSRRPGLRSGRRRNSNCPPNFQVNLPPTSWSPRLTPRATGLPRRRRANRFGLGARKPREGSKDAQRHAIPGRGAGGPVTATGAGQAIQSQSCGACLQLYGGRGDWPYSLRTPLIETLRSRFSFFEDHAPHQVS